MIISHFCRRRNNNVIFIMFILFMLLCTYSSSSHKVNFEMVDKNRDGVIDRFEFEFLEKTCTIPSSKRKLTSTMCQQDVVSADAFTAGSNCTSALPSGTCEYFCDTDSGYFLDNLTTSLIGNVTVPGHPVDMTLDPSLRYCMDQDPNQWYQYSSVFSRPQCLNQDIYEKLKTCTDQGSDLYNVYACDRMRTCFINDYMAGTSCKELDFSGPNNVLYYLYEGFFDSTPNLEILMLNWNYLGLQQDLSSDIFYPIRNRIQSIDLAENYLGSLNNVFQGLTALTSIKLDNNMLTTIEKDAFNETDMLFYLSLSGNRIDTIETGALANLETLNFLMLQSNHLTLLDSSTFAMNGASPKLKSLDLSSNRITHIASDTFSHLTGLKKLFLSYNTLTKIEPFTFSELNLVRLNLDNNDIHSLTANSFGGITISKDTGEIDLSDNPIVEILENSIQSVICTTARFVLTTTGTSYCSCHDDVVTCYCRGGSLGQTNSRGVDPTSCVIPNITSIDVDCSVVQDQNGCDGSGNTKTNSGLMTSSLENEVTAFSGLLNTYLNHIPPSTEGGDFLIFNFVSMPDNYVTTYTSTENLHLQLDGRKGSASCEFEFGMRLKCAIPVGFGITSTLTLTTSYNNSFGEELTFDIWQVEEFNYANPEISTILGCPSSGCNREGNNTIEIVGKNFGFEDALVFVNRDICYDVVHGSLSNRENKDCKGSVCHRSLTCITPALEDSQTQLTSSSIVKNTVNVVQSNLNGFANTANASFEYQSCPVGQIQNGGLCVNCESGSYSATEDALFCELCDAGSSQPESGKSMCVSCSVSYASVTVGSSQCNKCTYGKSTRGQTSSPSCTSCDFA